MSSDSNLWLTTPHPAEPWSPQNLMEFFGIPPGSKDQLEMNIREKRRRWHRRANSGNPDGRRKALEALKVINEAAAFLREHGPEANGQPPSHAPSPRQVPGMGSRLAMLRQRAARLEEQEATQLRDLQALEQRRGWLHESLQNAQAARAEVLTRTERRAERIRQELRERRLAFQRRRREIEEREPWRRQLETRQQAYVTAWLRKWKLKQTGKVELTAAQKEALARHRFFTAWDIDPGDGESADTLVHTKHGPKRVPGIGPTEIRALVAWRRFLEAFVRAHESYPRRLNPTERATARRRREQELARLDTEEGQAKTAADRELREVRRARETSLTEAEDALRAARAEERRWRAPLARIPALQAALDQTIKELNEVNQTLQLARTHG